MKRTASILAALFVLFAAAGTWAQTDTLKAPAVQHGKNFVDLNNDGYNDNAPDADGDGIPNGQDPDYVKPQDGSGAGQGQGKGQGKGFGRRMGGFVDEDGDGVNDRLMDADKDGVPNCQDSDWVKPQDGTGNKFGRGARMGKGFGSGQSTTTGEPAGKGGKRAVKGN